MRCPKCGAYSEVVRIRPHNSYAYRMRRCEKCGFEFVSRETFVRAKNDPELHESVLKWIENRRNRTRG